MEQKYICHKCKHRFNIDDNDMFCPFCSARIARTYSESYLEAENELIKNNKVYQEYKNKNTEIKKHYKNNMFRYYTLSDDINKFDTDIKKFIENSKVDRGNFEISCIDNINLSNIFDKYKTIFGVEYVSDKKYYIPKSKAEKDCYMEYIYLSTNERAKYDGLIGFEFISFKSINNSYLERTNGSREHSYIAKIKNNNITVFPGESISNNDYNDMYEYYNLIFDIETEECEELSKNQIENNVIIPAKLKKDDYYYTITKKGKIIHKIEKVHYEYKEEWE